MKRHTDTKTPSAKVGVALIIVVLVVVGTIFGSKIQLKRPVADLQNVELLIERKSMDSFKSGDEDQDNLPDWLEEFYRTDPQNPDTDGDGTPDGEEITLDRDPAVAGPNDPLITRKDLIADVNLENFVPGTISDKASIELFSEYLALKKQGVLKPEDEAKLVENLSKKITEQTSLKPKYTEKDLSVVPATKDSITLYGDRVAQIATQTFFRMDSHKNLKELNYILQIAKEYEIYAKELSIIKVPTVTKDVHLALLNHLTSTQAFFEAIVNADADPLSSLVLMSQYQATQTSDSDLYTTLARYFKNNAIIFDTESTIRFWNVFLQ